MMLRPSTVRTLILSSALLSASLFVACGSGGEKTNTASSNAPAANANQSNNNTANANAANANTAANTTAGQTATAGKPKLNLNTATGDEFRAQIPGLGDRMAHEFEEYRPYKSIQQFRREMGKYVKPEQIAEYEKYVYVPISANDSDALTLQQIPGLDATEATALIAGRPYASRDAFLDKLSEKVSADDLAVAKNYLSDK